MPLACPARRATPCSQYQHFKLKNSWGPYWGEAGQCEPGAVGGARAPNFSTGVTLRVLSAPLQAMPELSGPTTPWVSAPFTPTTGLWEVSSGVGGRMPQLTSRLA